MLQNLRTKIFKFILIFKSNPSRGVDRPLGLQEFESSRISRQSAHEDGKVVSPTRRPPLAPADIPGSNPGPWCDLKDKVNEKSNDPIGNRTLNLSACSAMPEATAPLLNFN
jgi:hypothetical protein